jgi:hypothetical protein
MAHAGVTCDRTALNFSVQLYVKGDDLAAARLVLDEMKQTGVPCTQVTHTQLFQLYLQRLDLQGAKELLKETHQSTENSGAFNSGRETAHFVISDVPSTGTASRRFRNLLRDKYFELLSCCSKQMPLGGMLTVAEEVLADMDAAGIQLDSYSAAAILRCCGRGVHPERAGEVMRLV